MGLGWAEKLGKKEMEEVRKNGEEEDVMSVKM